MALAILGKRQRNRHVLAEHRLQRNVAITADQVEFEHEGTSEFLPRRHFAEEQLVVADRRRDGDLSVFEYRHAAPGLCTPSRTPGRSRPPFKDPSTAPPAPDPSRRRRRSEEHTSELQSLMRISYAVFCLNKKHHIQSLMNTTDNNTEH